MVQHFLLQVVREIIMLEWARIHLLEVVEQTQMFTHFKVGTMMQQEQLTQIL